MVLYLEELCENVSRHFWTDRSRSVRSTTMGQHLLQSSYSQVQQEGISRWRVKKKFSAFHPGTALQALYSGKVKLDHNETELTIFQVLGEDIPTLKKTLHQLGIFLKPAMYKMDVRPLLKVVLSEFFGNATGLVDMISEHVPDPVAAAPHKVIGFNIANELNTHLE